MKQEEISNQEKFTKIAESVAEKLITSRQVEIERSATEQARDAVSGLVAQEIDSATQNIIASVQNLVSQIALNVINQEIPNIINRIIPEIESEVQELEKRTEEKISELSNRIEEIAASSEAKNQESNFNYEIEDPDGGLESSAYMEVGFDSADFHVLATKNGRLFWLATEDCQTTP